MNTLDFIREIKSRLRDIPNDKLTPILLELSQLISYSERYNVLKILDQYSGQSNVCTTPDVDFLEVTKALCDRVENGAYTLSWNFESDYDYYDCDYYDEYYLSDHDGLGEDLTNCLSLIMLGVEQREYEKAYQAFELLFDIALDPDGENEEKNYYEDENGDMYFVSDWISLGIMFDNNLVHADQRKVMLYYACTAIAALRGENRTKKLYDLLYPSYYDMSIADIILLLPDNAESKNFIDEWIDFLMDIGAGKSEITINPHFNEYLEKMIVDAIVTKGDDALCDFVKEHGTKYQSSYVKLIDKYLLSEQYGTASEAAKEALCRISGMGETRTKIADLLVKASDKTQNREMIRIGVLEGFLSCGDLKHFLAVLQLNDDEIIKKAVKFVRSKEGDDRDWYCIRFLTGDYISVWDEIRTDTASLGWSYSEKGKVFPLFIALLSIGYPIPNSLRTLVRNVTGRDIVDDFLLKFENITPPGKDDTDKIIEWCIAETLSRIDAIVGGQHRKSYDKTALLLISLAETLRVREDAESSTDLITQVKNKYPRHRAFHASLRECMENG